MYFKRLEMQGFKSFAEKTVIEFGDGITAVVGPNGSGKSNISDAVRWVLGEQRARSLRALSMEDVIFSGTETRKPVNFAEVSIIIDNTDGSLNVDYENVKITRRLFRSGKSEYLINDKIARLSDINLLLADTGIGKEGYSIIGQGKVDAILSTKSEIRRGIFEEASGIAKYRMRKKESESKLEQAEQNLVVIDGVINELAAQITLLKKQAVSAEQYLKLKYELRDIEVGVLVRGIEEAEAKLAEIKGKFDAVSGEISDGEKTVNQIRTKNDERNRLEEKFDAEYNEAKENASEADRSANEAQAAVTLNLQRIENVKNEIARMEGENREKKKQADENKKKIAEIEEEKKLILKDLAELEAEIGKEQRRLDIVINALSGGSEQASKMNREIVEKRLAAERHRSEVTSLGKQSEIYGERITQLEQEIEAGRSEMEQARANLDEMLAKYDSEAGTLSDLEKEFAAHTKTRDDTAAEIDEKNAQLARIKSEIDTGEAQLKLLRDMEQNFEGYARSVKEILSLCRQNRQFGRGIYGAVAQIITVGEEDEAAVEVALGNNFQDIITEDEESAKQAIEYLKENRFGRATFLPLTAVNAKYMDAEAMEKLKKVRGFVGIASNLVKYDPKYENAVAGLLGRVAVFEDIDAAIYAARQNKYSFMCVTREGDILRTSGAITGGSPEKGKRGSALSRTREIPEYEEAVQRAREKHDNYTKAIESLRVTLREETEKVSAIASSIREKEVSVASLTAELAAKKRIFDAGNERKTQLEKEIERQKTLGEDAAKRISESQKNAETLDGEIEKISGELEKIEEKSRELSGEKDRRQNGITMLKLKQADLSNRKTRAEDDLTRLRGEIELGTEYAQSVGIRSKEARDTEKNLLAENEQLTRKAEANRKENKRLTELCEQLAEKRRSNTAEIRNAIEKSNSIMTKIGFLREECGRLDQMRMRQEHDLEYNKTRLMEEYELTFERAREMAGDEEPENISAVKARIVELRATIKRLGNVNVASIEDLKTVTERHEFLTAQKKDVEESRTKLRKLINELEGVMKTQFLEQFKLIRENFREVYKKLFGGGKADVVLEDENDCLNCAIEINAQPPGGKMMNILQLSGGEKALTAIALLFGILMMSPTPFCILDEIEAALDEANVYKFAEHTKGLANDTQFILITHRKGTMEAANSLYGVTMEEKGVSKVLSLKLREKKK